MSIGNIFFQVDNKGATYSYLTTVIDDAKGSVASLRLCKDVTNWHVRDLLPDNADIFLVGPPTCSQLGKLA